MRHQYFFEQEGHYNIAFIFESVWCQLRELSKNGDMSNQLVWICIMEVIGD